MSQKTRVEKDEWLVPAVDAAGQRTRSTRLSLAPSPRYDEPYGEQFGEPEDQKWKAKYWQICCSSYIINLAIQAFLFTNVVNIEELELYKDKDIKGERNEEIRKVKF